jgi:hypothetical protein
MQKNMWHFFLLLAFNQLEIPSKKSGDAERCGEPTILYKSFSKGNHRFSTSMLVYLLVISHSLQMVLL